MMLKFWPWMDTFDMTCLKISMQLQSQCNSHSQGHLEDLATASSPHTLQLGVSVSTHYHCVLILPDPPLLLLLLWLLLQVLLLLQLLLLRLVCRPGYMGWPAFCRLPCLGKLRLSHGLSSMGAALLLLLLLLWPFLMMTKLLMLLQRCQWLPEQRTKFHKSETKKA